MFLAAAASLGVMAQDFDTTPNVNVENNDVRFTIGARMMSDVAYYHTDYTPMRSGAAITDARIRTSMEFDQWYFYADFDFSKGSFKQKNIYFCDTERTTLYQDFPFHPELLLKEYIAIFNPQLLPDYNTQYYKPLLDE